MISLGQRAIQGEYNTVLMAGELRVQDSRIKHLNCAGQVRVTKSTLGRVQCVGELIAEGSGFTRLAVTGEAKLSGICNGDIVEITGSITAEYLESRILSNGTGKKSKNQNQNNSQEQSQKQSQNRDCSWQGVFYAESFENCSDLFLDFEYKFKNIISYAKLFSRSEIECEEFYSFSSLEAEAVNADRILLLTQGEVKVGQLTGETITISRGYQPDQRFKRLPKTRGYKNQNDKITIASIGIMEADHIEVEYVKAGLISGTEVIIGDLCIIDRVEYRGSIKISDKAVVNEVVKL
jgi:hypothetical protein